MRDATQFLILGLGPAAVYALLAFGVVLIYRGSGVVNFAQSAFALLGAITFTEVRSHGVSAAWAVAAAVAVGALVGVLMQGVVMSRMRNSAPIVRVIATLGVLIVIQASAGIHYSTESTIIVPQFLPQDVWVVSGVRILADRIVLFGVALAVACLLAALQRFWLPAVAMRASAENELAASTLGWSPAGLALASWAAGGAMAGLAGALFVPLTGLLVTGIIALLVPSLAAALLGRFDSFSVCLLGAMVIGVTQSEVLRFWPHPGATTAVPLLLVMVILVVTGRALPLRAHLSDRLPSVGSGSLNLVPATILSGVLSVLLLFVLPVEWQAGIGVTIEVAIILLSLVVLTGYAGQISLGQYAVGGVGAYIAGRLVATQHVPFWVGMLVGIIGAIPVGLLFALPAIRTRGVNLAIVTLGLAVCISAFLFQNFSYTGGTAGTPVGTPRLFGLNLSAVTHPGRYAVFALCLFILCAVGVSNIRRGPAGRRMIAVRQNERAAASLGISVRGTKAYAFGVAAAIAATGCCLIAFNTTSIEYGLLFDPFNSVLAAGWAVIGGLGFILGPIFGATLAPGSVGTVIGDKLFHAINSYLTLIGGLFVILIVIVNPDGVVPLHAGQLRWIGQKLRGSFSWIPFSLVPRRWSAPQNTQAARASYIRQVLLQREPVRPARLAVSDLTVRFGGVVAVTNVSLEVRSGEVLGLIGPNGAGKTTVLDAITGFVKPAEGSVALNGVAITRATTNARVHRGVARSWQSLELFDDISVYENLLTAVDEPGWLNGALSPFRRHKQELNAAAAAAVSDFRLENELDKRPSQLSYGQRRLVAVARTVALRPSIILLDEPASGLNSDESAELGELIRHLATTWGMGVVLVEHDVDLVMTVSDRIVVLESGRVIASGTPGEIRRDPAVVAAYLGEPQEPVPVSSHGGAQLPGGIATVRLSHPSRRR